jgi:hypothetical protein
MTLATWEVDIPGQPGAKMFIRPHLNSKKLGMVGCTYHASDSGKHKIGESWSRLICAKNKTLS